MLKRILEFTKYKISKREPIRRLMNTIYQSININFKSEQEIKSDIINKFHKIYYKAGFVGGTWQDTYWLGTLILKYPSDLWIYQEIIYKLKPDIIIECGTYKGGSAFFLATICELVNNGKVLTIDSEIQEERPQHNRIQYFLGSSTSEEIVEQVKKKIREKDKIMVILDSDHHKEHVLEELRIYSELITKESYIIVEDTCINGHPVREDFGPGPMEAVKEFLKENKDFIIDNTKEKFYLTSNPRGYLKRIR